MGSDDAIAPYDGHGDRLLFENDNIAVWEEVFEPGQPTKPHRHMRDYIAVTVDAGELLITSLSKEPEIYAQLVGTLDASDEGHNRNRVKYSAGTILHASQPEGGHAHIAENTTSEPSRVILIELKKSNTQLR